MAGIHNSMSSGTCHSSLHSSKYTPSLLLHCLEIAMEDMDIEQGSLITLSRYMWSIHRGYWVCKHTHPYIPVFSLSPHTHRLRRPQHQRKQSMMVLALVSLELPQKHILELISSGKRRHPVHARLPLGSAGEYLLVLFA